MKLIKMMEIFDDFCFSGEKKRLLRCSTSAPNVKRHPMSWISEISVSRFLNGRSLVSWLLGNARDSRLDENKNSEKIRLFCAKL